jgi:cytoskeletal protein RodZ
VDLLIADPRFLVSSSENLKSANSDIELLFPQRAPHILIVPEGLQNMSKISAVNKYRAYLKDKGFSMLEAVVVVGVLLALAVGGFIAYGQITENAKKASVETAASSVYTAALAAESDGDSTTSTQKVQDEYNNSQDTIKVTITAAG